MIFLYYEGFENDVDFWLENYLREKTNNSLELNGVQYIAGKIDEVHSTKTPEQYESLERQVREVLLKECNSLDYEERGEFQKLIFN